MNQALSDNTIVLSVLSYLDTSTLCGTVPRVNRRYFTLSRSPILWAHCLRHARQRRRRPLITKPSAESDPSDASTNSLASTRRQEEEEERPYDNDDVIIVNVGDVAASLSLASSLEKQPYEALMEMARRAVGNAQRASSTRRQRKCLGETWAWCFHVINWLYFPLLAMGSMVIAVGVFISIRMRLDESTRPWLDAGWMVPMWIVLAWTCCGLTCFVCAKRHHHLFPPNKDYTAGRGAFHTFLRSFDDPTLPPSRLGRLQWFVLLGLSTTVLFFLALTLHLTQVVTIFNGYPSLLIYAVGCWAVALYGLLLETDKILVLLIPWMILTLIWLSALFVHVPVWGIMIPVWCVCTGIICVSYSFVADCTDCINVTFGLIFWVGLPLTFTIVLSLYMDDDSGKTGVTWTDVFVPVWIVLSPISMLGVLCLGFGWDRERHGCADCCSSWRLLVQGPRPPSTALSPRQGGGGEAVTFSLRQWIDSVRCSGLNSERHLSQLRVDDDNGLHTILFHNDDDDEMKP